MENSDKAVILKSSRGRLQEVGISPELPTLVGGHTWTFDRIFSLGSRVNFYATVTLSNKYSVADNWVPLKYGSRWLLKEEGVYATTTATATRTAKKQQV